MKLLILGGGNSQINAIKRGNEKGITTVVSDYYEDAPGKEISDFGELVSTFDVEGNIDVAKKYNIDGIMTIGTDQPIYTVANVANELKLPSFLNVSTAQAVTNKRIMKEIFQENRIPTVNYAFIDESFMDNELDDLKFPIVIKPVDSQGQRGIYKLNSIDEIREKIKDTLSYSREEVVLVEEYYESEEITVSGWVQGGNTHIILVTDRVTFSRNQHIGICLAHDFPSKHLYDYYEDIDNITRKIVDAFEIQEGPIYFQMLIGDEGVKVNEVACRIGGAYEDKLIPLLTEIDILDMVIDYSLGKEIDYTKLKEYDLLKNHKKASVQLFFARPGKIKYLSHLEEIKRLQGVIDAKFNFKVGDELKEIINATARAGYMIIVGEDNESLARNINKAFINLKIYDNDDNNLVIQYKMY
ncbi:ATP-grasp domain-containing protein [Sporosalibacterium faouarense]|uniref:ATP-grasp domain-containing protein n=1 Tax=Sporosalibacterium faouarense TaxID=516123 RepID=UPI00192B19B2|nr:ATP-grasp domain-containing protein [Sporosalibacterium faouarense]